MPTDPLAFRPFGATHAIVIVGFAIGLCALILAGNRARRGGSTEVLDRWLAGIAAAAWVGINGWLLRPDHFDIRTTLPIHVSDISLLIVPICLIHPARWARAALYFFGLGLGVQAFITPDLRDGPASAGFWMFWISHYLTVGVAIYDLVCRRYRPTWRDYRTVVILGVSYFAVILPINIALRANYGYVGPTDPGQPTLIDYFGPWPQRVPILMVLGAAWMAVMVVPWEVARRRMERREGPD